MANAAALTLAPGVRLRTWNTPLRWEHWVGMAVWVLVFSAAHLSARRRLPKRDPYLLPIIGLLSGWGLLNIWRLLPGFGLRQTAWLAICGITLTVGMGLPSSLRFLRRYKYVWMLSSLLLTAATLLIGVNPLGYGPPMWFGLGDIYLQPSELLKLLLIAYLSAYLADRQPYLVLAAQSRTPITRWMNSVLPLLAPTLIMVGAALAVLVGQRDLGTATIFLTLYAVMVYVSVGRRRIIIASGGALVSAGLLGYALYDVVRVRVDAWLNPWLDPSGRSYQIVQALIAIANGGAAGRGPGLGSPGLAPLAHSDLIFVALTEENGLWGAAALLLLYGLFIARGLIIAMQAGDHYRRYLAAGLTTLLGGQALLIIAGNLRLLPLTGVTLPFVSYGGSSLLTSFIAVTLLLLISSRPEPKPARLYSPQPYLALGATLLLGLSAAAGLTGWWGLARAPELLARTDNQRRIIGDRYVRRGALYDRNDVVIAQSNGQPGSYTRRLDYPQLSNLVGYSDAAYGQTGLEAGLGGVLRGFEGQPALENGPNQAVGSLESQPGARVYLDRLLYGQPPPGLDVRLSLDLDLQTQADAALDGHAGAIVWLDASSGEILALASHPVFDANRLGEDWENLVRDPLSPLVNRAVQGRYPLGDLFHRLYGDNAILLAYDPAGQLPLPPESYVVKNSPQGLTAGPLQAAFQAAALSNQGQRPTPVLALARRAAPGAGWIDFSDRANPVPIFSADQAQSLLHSLRLDDHRWGTQAAATSESGERVVWYVGGALPGAPGPNYVIVIVLEKDAPLLAQSLFNQLLPP